MARASLQDFFPLLPKTQGCVGPRCARLDSTPGLGQECRPSRAPEKGQCTMRERACKYHQREDDRAEEAEKKTVPFSERSLSRSAKPEARGRSTVFSRPVEAVREMLRPLPRRRALRRSLSLSWGALLGSAGADEDRPHLDWERASWKSPSLSQEETFCTSARFSMAVEGGGEVLRPHPRQGEAVSAVREAPWGLGGGLALLRDEDCKSRPGSLSSSSAWPIGYSLLRDANRRQRLSLHPTHPAGAPPPGPGTRGTGLRADGSGFSAGTADSAPCSIPGADGGGMDGASREHFGGTGFARPTRGHRCNHLAHESVPLLRRSALHDAARLGTARRSRRDSVRRREILSGRIDSRRCRVGLGDPVAHGPQAASAALQRARSGPIPRHRSGLSLHQSNGPHLSGAIALPRGMASACRSAAGIRTRRRTHLRRGGAASPSSRRFVEAAAARPASRRLRMGPVQSPRRRSLLPFRCSRQQNRALDPSQGRSCGPEASAAMEWGARPDQPSLDGGRHEPAAVRTRKGFSPVWAAGRSGSVPGRCRDGSSLSPAFSARHPTGRDGGLGQLRSRPTAFVLALKERPGSWAW